MSNTASTIFLEYAISHPTVGFTLTTSEVKVPNQEVIAVKANNATIGITILDVITELGYLDNIIPSDILFLSPDINSIYTAFLADDTVSTTDKDIVRAAMDPLLANVELLSASYIEHFLTPLFENYNIVASKIYVTIPPNGVSTSPFYTNVITMER